MLNRVLRSALWEDRLEFFDDEANPVDMTDWGGRITVYGPLGNSATEVLNSTSSPVVVITEPFMDFKIAASTISTSGAYVVALLSIDAAGKERVRKRDVVYFE